MRQIEEKCSQYELTIDRLTREKISLKEDLDAWREHIQQQEIGLNQVKNIILIFRSDFIN